MGDTKPRRRRHLLWLLLPLLAALALAGEKFMLQPARLQDNEKAASTGLKTLTSAEADFRANDRDWNHVNDFWTGDVAGLYYVQSNEKGNEKEVHLIDRAIAEADVRPLKALVTSPVPYHGYYFIALDEDDAFAGSSERFYKEDSGGTPAMGKVHHTSKFGFCAYPAQYGVTGKYTYLVNENNTIFRSDNGGKSVTHFPKDEASPVYSICPIER